MRKLASSAIESYPTPSNTFFENQLLTTKGAAQLLGVSESLIRKMKVSGHLPFILVGGRAVRFRLSALNQWIEERETYNGTKT